MCFFAYAVLPVRGDALEMNADVVVVGYGPSGGSLAYYLGREGLDVVVVDKRVGIWPLPRAGHVDDEIMRAWQGMGLAEELAPTLTEVPDYEYYRSDWSRYFTMPNSPGITDQGWPTHAFFNQPVFERALRRRVAKMPNVHLLLGATLTGIEDDEAGVTATLEDAESTKVAIHAAYLAGFDGA